MSTLQVRKLLGIKNDEGSVFTDFRTGARTRAVLATKEGVAHRFSEQSNRVVVKLYKGDGSSPGSKQYQEYHQKWFHHIEALTGNSHIQQSLDAGVFAGLGPYAVLQYVDGQELAVRLDATDLSRSTAGHILRDILLEIWLPLWEAGLRFKDCHPGNFVLTSQGRAVMIDTEQMRKDADELLHRSDDWSQRLKHQDQGLKRLPKLIQRVLSAAQPSLSDAAVLRVVKQAIGDTSLPEALARLGQSSQELQRAEAAVAAFLHHLQREGLIE